MLINMPFLVAGFLIKTLFFVRRGMGREYVAGLAAGLRLCARMRHRRRFLAARCVPVQLELWRNLLRLFIG